MLSAVESIDGTRASRGAYFDVSLELLRTIANVLDIRPVLPQISGIVNKMLPHDALALASVERDGQVGIEAATGDVPAVLPLVFGTPFAEDFIIGDLTSEPLPAVHGIDPTPRLVASGYRSVLCIAKRAGQELLGLAFWSKHRGAYNRCDLPMARLIVDHIAVAVSHDRMSRAGYDTASARFGGTRVDDRVRSVCTEVNRKWRSVIVGQSAEWQGALRKAAQVAATDTTVLVSGESGTGKEVVARFIHQASARKSGPFVALNCAALPEQLLEAELFGYERGAFTSAEQPKPGLIELAAGGVLFLDEISEMSLAAQAKFLRVLQEREFQRLGGTRLLKANIRVVAATNRELRKAVAQGDFREDLFYRVQVFDIHIAPLRERRGDILPLSEAFLQELGRSFARPPATLTAEAGAALLRYDWPGNVRELRNALERAVILCDDGLITPQHLSLESTVKGGSSSDTTDLGTIEREAIAKVLRDCRGNKAYAARRLGLSRTQLYVRIRRYGLEEAAVA
ncbi:MAG TPA: sigma 54-interacting transcriptional regulator [Vicinamibacterales bacterium]|jgi:DNA-binding NtrC family response regulator|nr:sigma 54-interacting transcriptional regulator [Vicinamibacterales bacterium]